MEACSEKRGSKRRSYAHTASTEGQQVAFTVKHRKQPFLHLRYAFKQAPNMETL